MLFARADRAGLHAPIRRCVELRRRSALRIVSAGFPFYAYGMVLTQAFNGAGDTWTPTLINSFCFWLWEIPLAWLLAQPLGFGPTRRVRRGAVGFSTMAVVSVVLFRRGRWKRVKV